jgi:hypothetical protein
MTMDVIKMFGANGFRLELFKSGGYAMHQWDGDNRGWHGRLCCMVAFPISEFERKRLIRDSVESGTLVCSTWIPCVSA